VNTPPELINHPFIAYQAGVIAKLENLHAGVVHNLGKAVITLTKASESYQARIQDLESQLKWFQKNVFGKKSERRVPQEMPSSAEQLPLLEVPATSESVVVKTTEVEKHTRKKSIKVIPANNCGESALRFGPEVRIEEVPIANPATIGLTPDQYEIIETRVQDKLCQEKSVYYVKRYTQPVVKLRATGEVKSPPAVERIIDSAIADLSVLVGTCLDKGLYHLPLYRQHQRMARAGITISRGTLTTWASGFIDLFTLVYNAQQLSILDGSVLSMDETPYKIGQENGKMKNQYLWFMYGDKDEVLIHPNEHRSAAVVEQLLKNSFKGTLLVDKLSSYQAAAKKLDLIVAHCWAHARRYFVEAEEHEPLASKAALDRIRQIYKLEMDTPKNSKASLRVRSEQIKPLVESFFDWLVLEHARIDSLPSTNYSKAVNYALEAKAELMVFLANPAVPIDNNHTERQIRPLVLGRKNFLFCWSELGATQLAILQSLLLTCQLHRVDPWEYFTDVAIRISAHPRSQIEELTPRRWKMLFSKNNTTSSINAA